MEEFFPLFAVLLLILEACSIDLCTALWRSWLYFCWVEVCSLTYHCNNFSLFSPPPHSVVDLLLCLQSLCWCMIQFGPRFDHLTLEYNAVAVKQTLSSPPLCWHLEWRFKIRVDKACTWGWNTWPWTLPYLCCNRPRLLGTSHDCWWCH